MLPSKIDWFRILADLRNAGYTQVSVANRLGVPRSRVRDWSAGTTPRFDDGALLVIMWLKQTQKLTGEIHIDVQNNTVAEQMATACLSIRFVKLPRKGLQG